MAKGGFDFNPDAVRGFAEVFNQAKQQVDQIKANVANTTAKAPDFGKAWASQGGEFEAGMKALSDDLANLSTHLNNIYANLMHGTHLTVNADSSGFSNIKTIEQQMQEDGSKSIPPGAGGH